MQKEYNNQRIQHFFSKYTSFSSKRKPKTHKNQNAKFGTGPTRHRGDEAADKWF